MLFPQIQPGVPPHPTRYQNDAAEAPSQRPADEPRFGIAAKRSVEHKTSTTNVEPVNQKTMQTKNKNISDIINNNVWDITNHTVRAVECVVLILTTTVTTAPKTPHTAALKYDIIENMARERICLSKKNKQHQ